MNTHLCVMRLSLLYVRLTTAHTEPCMECIIHCACLPLRWMPHIGVGRGQEGCLPPSEMYASHWGWERPERSSSTESSEPVLEGKKKSRGS